MFPSPLNVPVNWLAVELVLFIPTGIKPVLPQTSLPVACSDTAEPVAEAGADITKLVALEMEEMVAPAGIPLPEIKAPTKRLAVLGTVTVVEPFVVVALSVVPLTTALMFDPKV